jgi:phosphatidylglycerol:prolipoprotein diacylglycerol transferase
LSGGGLLIASIPYRTFPTIPLGPVELHTFGLMVALGVFVGTAIAVRLMPPAVDRDHIVSLAGRMVLAGIVGARLTWVITHFGSLDSPLDAVAIWEGGLQFSGGFLAACALAVPAFRRWPAELRRQVLDRFAIGLAVGLAIGRVGCYAVGEHLGRPTGFPLATRYLGGDTREGPLEVGVAIHNTSLYENLHLLVLAGLLWWIVVHAHRPPPAGTGLAVFCLWYGVGRFATDALRAYDDRVAGLTGAQWMCLGLVVIGSVLLVRARSRRQGAVTLG